ncbi:MAG TPA: DUF3108 domain-containing protein [Candidatus Acidoferrales bacterium]|nr:DUF3108 domain-containing protein [Candidatus Acidoferrales bacterium]
MSLSVAVILLLALRAVYAISFFNGLNNELRGSSWLGSEHDSVMQIKEELTYEASYLLFKIGAVRFQVLSKTTYDSIPAYRLRAYIDSYSGIPFVDLHAVYETYADARTLMCLSTSNSQKEHGGWVYTRYDFNYERKNVNWEQFKDGKMVSTIDFPIDHPYTDGVSFFYYLRTACENAGNNKTSFSIPIVVDTTRSSVDLTINEEREPCEVTAFDFPVDSYRMSGHINFTGFYGVTGDFVGWMSSDSAELPLKGDVKVVLGSVVVKLKDIKRDNWIPTKSNSQ